MCTYSMLSAHFLQPFKNGALVLTLSVQPSQHQRVLAAEPGEDHVYPGLEAVQAALRGAAGGHDGPALPRSALLLPALRAQPQVV